jgi:hypothetical protein
MNLRPYQSDAIAAVYEHLRARDDNPCVVIPTGGGKTPVIATICRDAVTRWNGRVVILAHVKELLEQAADKLRLIAPDVPVGIYSAGLKRKDLGYAVTIAGIQSIWKKACDLGPVDLIIVDEAHMVPAEDDGMYRQFIADAKVVNPHVRSHPSRTRGHVSAHADRHGGDHRHRRRCGRDRGREGAPALQDAGVHGRGDARRWVASPGRARPRGALRALAEPADPVRP